MRSDVYRVPSVDEIDAANGIEKKLPGNGHKKKKQNSQKILITFYREIFASIIIFVFVIFIHICKHLK